MGAYLDFQNIYRIAVNAGAAASTVLATGVSGKKLVLLSAWSGASTTGGKYTFTSGTNLLTSSMSHGTVTGIMMPFNPFGWCTATIGASLKIRTTGANAVIRGMYVIGEINA